VDALVRDGLVARGPDPDLPRAVRATLLPAGRALLARAERDLAVAAERAARAVSTPLRDPAGTPRRGLEAPDDPRAAGDPGLVQRELERELRARGSSVAGLRVLAALGAGACRMRELAAAAGTSPSRLSRIVDELEHAGLVRRTPDPRDGRAALAEATADGLAHLAAMRGVHDAVVHARFVEPLGAERLAALAAG
jgi:DNA-binding MarR family transcriptional regulator